jgi:Protein of unknown function (DUF5818)
LAHYVHHFSVGTLIPAAKEIAMRARNSSITAQGVLSLVAIAMMLGYAVHALQLSPPQSVTAYAQDRQPPVSATQQAGPDAEKPAVFAGTIVQLGSAFLLRGSSGAVYRLDDSSRAQQFAGLPVKVTGKLDSTLKVIRVVKIEETRA